jgi:hypothetical protein
MEIKVMENPIPTGYMDLEDCIKSWGDKGRIMYNGLIRQSMNFNGFSNKDIHTPLDGDSLRSMESPTPFIPFIKGSKKI